MKIYLEEKNMEMFHMNNIEMYGFTFWFKKVNGISIAIDFNIIYGAHGINFNFTIATKTTIFLSKFYLNKKYFNNVYYLKLFFKIIKTQCKLNKMKYFEILQTMDILKYIIRQYPLSKMIRNEMGI